MEEIVEWYVCRHGETTDNQRDVWTGQLPGKLNEEGERFAQGDLAELIRLIQPTAVYSSDLKRAVDTKNIAIRSAGYQGPHYEDEKIRELRFSGFHGLTINEIQELIRSNNLKEFFDFGYYDLRCMLADSRKPLEERFDIEPLEEIKRRVSLFSKNVVRHLPIERERRIVSIGHGMINAHIVEHELYGTCGYKFDRNGQVFYPQSNTEITMFRYDKEGILIDSEINLSVTELISRLNN